MQICVCYYVMFSLVFDDTISCPLDVSERYGVVFLQEHHIICWTNCLGIAAHDVQLKRAMSHKCPYDKSSSTRSERVTLYRLRAL